MGLTTINPAVLPEYPRMSWAVGAGDLLFLSGIVAIDRGGEVIGPGDPALQAEACLDIIETILAEGGSSVADIVKLTCFATSREVARAYVAARGRRWTEGRPAATSVIVDALLNPAIVLEIEAIARIAGDGE